MKCSETIYELHLFHNKLGIALALYPLCSTGQCSLKAAQEPCILRHIVCGMPEPLAYLTHLTNQPHPVNFPSSAMTIRTSDGQVLFVSDVQSLYNLLL